MYRQISIPPYQMLAVDLNPGLFVKATAEAKAEKLSIRFLPLDLNYVNIKENSFDLIFAHASLHHLLNLEHVFSQIHRGLKDNGRLIVQDVIGKTQVLFWKENVDFTIDLVNKMPSKYNAGISLPPYSEPSIQQGMEGIRQEEIEPLLRGYLTPIKILKYGSFMRMICTHPQLGKRFNPDTEADRQYLQSLFELDVRQVGEGKLRPTEMLAVYEKKDNKSAMPIRNLKQGINVIKRLMDTWGGKKLKSEIRKLDAVVFRHATDPRDNEPKVCESISTTLNYQLSAHRVLSRYTSFKDKKILEIGGAQSCESAYPFLNDGASEVIVTGLDHISQKESREYNLHILHADALKLSCVFEPCSFDIVYGLSIVTYSISQNFS